MYAAITVPHSRARRAATSGPLVLLLIAALASLAIPALGAGGAPLTLGELRSLLLIGQPDDEIAAAIRTRGVAFEVDREVLSDVRRKGAGRATLDALSAHLAGPVLVVATTPADCEILVDGEVVKSTASSGGRRISSATAGSHVVLVRKTGYRDGEKRVQLRAGEVNRIEVTLQALPAAFELAGSQPGLVVTINGKSLSGSRVEVPAGTHEVHFACPVCRPTTQQVTLSPGETHVLDPQLETDPDAVTRLLEEMRFAADHGDSEKASDAAKVLLRHLPEDPEVLAAAARGFYLDDDKGSFVSTAKAAVLHGAQVRLPVLHRDTKMEGVLEDSYLVITKDRISFEPLDANCTLARPPYALTELGSFSLRRDDGYLWLELGFMRADGRKEETLRLADRGTTLRPAAKQKSLAGLMNVQYRGFVMELRPGAERSLESIRALLAELALRS